MASELPINVDQSIEDVEEDIREYINPVTLPEVDRLHVTIITAAKIVEAALDRQTNTLEAALDRQTVQFTIMAEKQTIMAEKLTLIETYQKKLKELGEGDGIHWRRPSEFLTGAATFKVKSNLSNRINQVSIENVNQDWTGGSGSGSGSGSGNVFGDLFIEPGGS